MAYKKTLIWENGSESLNKTLNSRYNCEYKFKQISIREIQAIYIFILW